MPELFAAEKRVGLHYTQCQKCFIESAALMASLGPNFMGNLSRSAKVGLICRHNLGANAARRTLRERGRLADVVREGYTKSGLALSKAVRPAFGRIILL
jgi:hypothetical protein